MGIEGETWSGRSAMIHGIFTPFIKESGVFTEVSYVQKIQGAIAVKSI